VVARVPYAELHTGSVQGRFAGLERREAELCHALRDAYLRHDEIRMLLDIGLDKRLDEIASSGNLRVVIYELVSTSKSQGWQEALIEAVIADRPDNPMLKEWIEKYHWPKRPEGRPEVGSSPRWQLLDSVYFDLKQIRSAIRQAIASSSDRILGFGVTYPELMFVDKLRDLVPHLLPGETLPQQPLSLRPDLFKVSHQVRQVGGYRRDLDSANVLCVVHVAKVPQDCISDFWGQVCREFSAADRHLVLLFAGDDSTAFPPGVTVLPPPKFDLDDVALWAENTVIQNDWPLSLGIAWADLLRAYAFHDGELDIRMLYEEMDRTIKEIRFNADTFRLKLENRI
jgi:hypothetical protein